jgi:hypothetical protein
MKLIGLAQLTFEQMVSEMVQADLELELSLLLGLQLVREGDKF